MTNDSPTPESVTGALLAFLRRHGCAAELVTPGLPMPTVALAASAAGVEPDQILKSLLFVDHSGAVVLAIASGMGKINRDRLAAHAKTGRLKLANPDTVRRATGFPVGGVAPVGHADRIPVVIDHRVMALADAYGGGGAEDVLLRIAPADIQRLTGGLVADIADPAAGLVADIADPAAGRQK